MYSTTVHVNWKSIFNLYTANLECNFLISFLYIFYLFRLYGELSLCRKVLLMGVNSASDDPERMCHELLQFEREQGIS